MRRVSNRNIALAALFALGVLGALVYYIFVLRSPVKLTQYTNQEFGFAFKYPEAWGIEESINREGTESLTVFVSSNEGGAFPTEFQLGIAKLTEGGLTYEDLKEAYEGSNANVEETEVDGYKALRIFDPSNTKTLDVLVFTEDGRLAVASYFIAEDDVESESGLDYIDEFNVSVDSIDIF